MSGASWSVPRNYTYCGPDLRAIPAVALTSFCRLAHSFKTKGQPIADYGLNRMLQSVQQQIDGIMYAAVTGHDPCSARQLFDDCLHIAKKAHRLTTNVRDFFKRLPREIQEEHIYGQQVESETIALSCLAALDDQADGNIHHFRFKADQWNPEVALIQDDFTKLRRAALSSERIHETQLKIEEYTHEITKSCQLFLMAIEDTAARQFPESFQAYGAGEKTA
ncbi:unnamed protein product, partial [Mesorhabditis spiculigera]